MHKGPAKTCFSKHYSRPGGLENALENHSARTAHIAKKSKKKLAPAPSRSARCPGSGGEAHKSRAKTCFSKRYSRPGGLENALENHSARTAYIATKLKKITNGFPRVSKVSGIRW